MDTYKKT